MFFIYLFLFNTVILQLNAFNERDRHVVYNQLRTSIQYANNIKGMTPKLSKLNYEYNEDKHGVIIQFFYETLCRASRVFFSGQFKQTTDALGPYLSIYLYPYGTAETKIRDGRVKFTCHHGTSECYGNKLHACAVDKLSITSAISFNSCMMDNGSNDTAADVCDRFGMSHRIKICANGKRGTTLHRFYGEESKRANVYYVPYILINGVESDGKNFMEDVCKAFKNPPPACNELIYSDELMYSL